ncbi:hypothetical protein EXIGLDRAFT_781425 [Exidia glandulosa HHB12029]|uniref:Uncharacterized protein n=1 Tax=Exidia glandulosa HHB12029 TaxID=1314781 RepID=A0A165B928_EXIGL|nr:hypothetical protein EXIGLDRAFT_781425 [Exidia glandulosa HHB12029]
MATPSSIALEHLSDFIYYSYGFYSTLYEEPLYAPFKAHWLKALGDPRSLHDGPRCASRAIPDRSSRTRVWRTYARGQAREQTSSHDLKSPTRNGCLFIGPAPRHTLASLPATKLQSLGSTRRRRLL